MTGYKKKPILISIFAVLYLLNPVGNFLFLWFLNSKYSFNQFIGILINYFMHGNAIVIINICLWFIAIPLAYGLYKVRLWAWYYFLIHSVCMFILSFIDQKGFHPSIGTLINFVFLIPIGYFISKEIRTPYFNPRVRWWEQPKRLKHKIQINLEKASYNTFDISIAGAFIINNAVSNLKIGNIFPIEINLDNSIIKCLGEIRWINTNGGKYPIGCGIKFTKLSIKNKLKIRSFIKLLIASGKEIYR